MANNLQRLKEYFDTTGETMNEFQWEKLGPDHQSKWIGKLRYLNTYYIRSGKTKREVKEQICSDILKRVGLLQNDEKNEEDETDDDEEGEEEPGLSEIEELKAEVKELRRIVLDTREELENLAKLIDMIDD